MEIIVEIVVFLRILSMCGRNQDRCSPQHRQRSEQLESREELSLAIRFFGRHRDLRARSAPGNNYLFWYRSTGLDAFLVF